MAENRTAFYSQGPGCRDGLGIQRLTILSTEMKSFFRSWEEDLDKAISVYETITNTCQINIDEKLNAIPVMPSGAALLFYS